MDRLDTMLFKLRCKHNYLEIKMAMQEMIYSAQMN